MAMTNALAYYDMVTVTAVKIFIAQASGILLKMKMEQKCFTISLVVPKKP